MFRLPCLFFSLSYSTGVERTPLVQPPHQLKVFGGDRGRFGGGKRGLSPESPSLSPPNLPSPSPKTFVCGRRSGFVLSNGPIGALPLIGRFKANTSSQNGQAFSVTCSLLHARNASNGRHAEKPFSVTQDKKSCEQGFDNVKSLWGEGEEGPFSRKVPPPLPRPSSQ